METTEKKEEKTEINTDFERKRETISFQVNPKEKREVTSMAAKVSGISVSEFIRTKIFVEPKKTEAIEALPNPMDDEERAIYDDKIKEVREENRILKDELIKTKVLKSVIVPGEDKSEVENKNVNEVAIKLEPEFKEVFDKIKQYREEQFQKLDPEKQKDYYDFNKFLKVMFLRGVKRSYFYSDLKNSTGLGLSEFDKIAELCEISDDDY